MMPKSTCLGAAQKEETTTTTATKAVAFVDNTTTTTALQPTYISQLILGMSDCLSRLGAHPTNKQLEDCAIFIHESMSTSSRNYHSVKHVFDLTDGWDDPIGILSAYFHDCIYYFVDGGLSSCQKDILQNVLDTECAGGGLKLKSDPDNDDDLFRMCLSIFGFHPNQDMSLTPTGFNEFLSALTACRHLHSLLDKRILAQIVCCIEATIAFRPIIDDKTPCDRLYDRMLIANEECHLGLCEDELVEAVQRAALLSNRDLGNFGSPDPAYFLDNTWGLLPELNQSLRHQFCYTVAEFHEAVVKMNGFFSFLKPNVIFASFRGVPSDNVIGALQSQATRNLEIGRIYVGAKVLAVSMLAAFATLTGGDAPMSLFLGDLPSRHHVSFRLEDCLPEHHATEQKCDLQVYDILANGRKSEMSFDIRQSPLAAYLYSCMGTDGVMEALQSCGCVATPMTTETAKVVLRTLPREAVMRVAHNMAKVALSRQELLLQIVSEMEDGDSNGDASVDDDCKCKRMRTR